MLTFFSQGTTLTHTGETTEVTTDGTTEVEEATTEGTTEVATTGETRGKSILVSTARTTCGRRC